jgi:tetratricopeptide (TPR) repeat protein
MKSALTGIQCIAVWVLMALIANPLLGSAKVPNTIIDSVRFINHQFDSLRFIAKEKRVDAAVRIHKTKFRHLPEREAMNNLDQFTAIARELDDKPLENVVLDLKADYYAVNNLYNNKSISYYRQAIDFSRRNDLVLEEAIYLLHEGMFNYIYKHNNQACLSYLRSLEIFKKYGFKKVPNISSYLWTIAEFYYHIGDYKNAKAYLQQALQYKIEKPRGRITVVNTLGLIARNEHKYPEALGHFGRALKMAQASKDTIWVSIVDGNIGSIYFLQGQYDKALPYIQTDYQTSLKYHEKINAAIALLRLVKISLVKGDTQKSLQQLNEAESLINTPVPDLNLRTELFDLKAQIYEQMDRYEQAVGLRKKYQLIKDSLNAQNNIAAVEVVRMQYVLNKQQAEENRLKVQSKIRGIQRNAIFVVLFLVVIILILLYNRQKLKIRKNQELLNLEKKRLDDELKYTAMKLTAYTENLRKNNVLIERFKEQIEGLKNKKADSAVVHHLEELMQAHIMTDESWMEFKKIFLKVYPNFFFDIKKSFLSLSETDLRLLTLIKLQCTNKETANMLGITVEGVKKAKQRLRKKMQLEDDITIEEAISRL